MSILRRAVTSKEEWLLSVGESKSIRFSQGSSGFLGWEGDEDDPFISWHQWLLRVGESKTSRAFKGSIGFLGLTSQRRVVHLKKEVAS
jgi:hypothetical protein